MGIYDRDYYRNDGRSVFASFTEHGQMCKWLIIVNIVAFALQWLTATDQPVVVKDADDFGHVISYETTRQVSPFTDALQLDVHAVAHGQIWRLLTYAFLHSIGIYHILFNMLFLWWFGTDVEDLYGPREFLTFYLVAAFLGGLVFFLCWLAGLSKGQLCIGASGAVTAVLVLCAIHYPSRTILLFFFLPVPIWLFVAFSVGRDLFAFISHQEGGTAVTVHLAGAAFAYVYHQQNLRLLNLAGTLRNWQRRLSRPKLRVYREEEPREPVPVASAAPRVDADEHLEAKMDAILEKVKRTGMDSLTDAERQILFRASEAIRRRRS